MDIFNLAHELLTFYDVLLLLTKEQKEAMQIDGENYNLFPEEGYPIIDDEAIQLYIEETIDNHTKLINLLEESDFIELEDLHKLSTDNAITFGALQILNDMDKYVGIDFNNELSVSSFGSNSKRRMLMTYKLFYHKECDPDPFISDTLFNVIENMGYDFSKNTLYNRRDNKEFSSNLNNMVRLYKESIKMGEQ